MRANICNDIYSFRTVDSLCSVKRIWKWNSVIPSAQSSCSSLFISQTAHTSQANYHFMKCQGEKNVSSANPFKVSSVLSSRHLLDVYTTKTARQCERKHSLRLAKASSTIEDRWLWSHINNPVSSVRLTWWNWTRSLMDWVQRTVSQMNTGCTLTVGIILNHYLGQSRLFHASLF